MLYIGWCEEGEGEWGMGFFSVCSLVPRPHPSLLLEEGEVWARDYSVCGAKKGEGSVRV